MKNIERRIPTRRAIAAFAALPLLTSTPSAAAAAEDAEERHAERMERLVRAFWDAFNRAAWSELDALVSPTYVHHSNGASLTLADFKAGGAWVHQGLADYNLLIDQVIQQHNTVAIRWTAHGRHVGSMFGETPTGREIVAFGMHFQRIDQLRIAEDWEVIDMDQFKRQLVAR